MGKGFRELNWIVVAVIFAFALSSINTINSFVVKKKQATFCTVDIWQISNDIALKASEQNQNISPDAVAKNEAIAKEVNAYMQTIRDRISSPRKYGCDYIAVKGSIFGENLKDITEQVIKDVNVK
jgi:Skp family chaperone for outer membrane proteins